MFFYKIRFLHRQFLERLLKLFFRFWEVLNIFSTQKISNLYCDHDRNYKVKIAYHEIPLSSGKGFYSAPSQMLRNFWGISRASFLYFSHLSKLLDGYASPIFLSSTRTFKRWNSNSHQKIKFSNFI